MAKGIASGLPLSGILARKELMDRLPPGSHGGTYGGNVVSCAAANATLDVIEDEGLVANARERGAQLLDGLRRACCRPGGGRRRPRASGLMVAIELVKPGEGDGRVPDPDLTKRIQREAFARKLLVLTAGTYVNVIRIIPPLVTTADEVDRAIGILGRGAGRRGSLTRTTSWPGERVSSDRDRRTSARRTRAPTLIEGTPRGATSDRARRASTPPRHRAPREHAARARASRTRSAPSASIRTRRCRASRACG